MLYLLEQRRPGTGRRFYVWVPEQTRAAACLVPLLPRISARPV